jgi:hypothetical protein
MKTDPNEPIVPCDGWANVPSYGLTKREYFATMAMQGYLASVPNDTIERPEYAASHAVRYADALINELNKTE